MGVQYSSITLFRHGFSPVNWPILIGSDASCHEQLQGLMLQLLKFPNPALRRWNGSLRLLYRTVH